MANTYGSLYGGNKRNDSKSVTRVGSEYVASSLETWQGKITTELLKDGNFRIYISEKHGSLLGKVVARGNVGNDGRYIEVLSEDGAYIKVSTNDS